MQSFDPGEDWFWSFSRGAAVRGVALAPPTSQPGLQPTAGAVPADWMEPLHQSRSERRRNLALDQYLAGPHIIIDPVAV